MGGVFSSSKSKPSKSPQHPLVNPPLTTAQTQFLAALPKAKIRGKIRTQKDLTYIIDILPWNLRCTPKPLAIVYASSPSDVSIAVKLAAQFGISVQPRSGGHSFGSYSLGGTNGALVIDLSPMDEVKVDQKTWLATIGGGTKLKKVTDELYSQGKRCIAHGVCPQVGIGGHATIGGQGPLTRKYGLTLDHVAEVEVVLADGAIVKANEKENSDLFWALRGAGASFGIITTFTFVTHPTPTTVTHYSVQLTFSRSPSVLAQLYNTWQSFVSSPAVINDREFNSAINITKSIVLVQGSRMGTKAELEASQVMIVLKKLFGVEAFGGGNVEVKMEEIDWLGSISNWATDQINTIAGGLSIPMYMKSLTVRQSKPLTPAAVTAWFNYMHDHSPGDAVWLIIGDLEAGRISDIASDATSYAHRDALCALTAYALAPLPFPDDVLGFLNGMMSSITDAMPDGDFGVYPGYVDPLLPRTQWPALYWGTNYPRLFEIKRKYDPKNVFSNPQSVGMNDPEFANAVADTPADVVLEEQVANRGIEH